MRVLSPRIEPRVRVDDGSTASTATRCPSAVSRVPSASMNVDFPTPGTPLMPTRCAPPACGSSSISSCWAACRWSGRARLDERDRAREHRARPVEHALGQRGDVDGTAPSARAALPVSLPQQVDRGLGDHGARPEHRRRAHLLERAGTSAGGITPPTTTMMSGAVELGQRVAQLGHQREVPGGERVTPRRRARRPRRPAAPPRRGSGTAGRRRRRSRGRRTRWRSPSGRGRGRPGPSSRRGCAAGALLGLGELVDQLAGPRRSPGSCPASSEYTPEMILI